MSEESQALVAALGMLGRRDHFRSEIRDKLVDKGFSPDVISTVCSRCGELGYLDDRKNALRFTEQRSMDRGWGPRRVELELRRRGVAPEDIDVALADPGVDWPAALEKAVVRAERRAKTGWWRGREGRFRMVSSLLRRGFEPDVARAAIDRLAQERETTHASHEEP